MEAFDAFIATVQREILNPLITLVALAAFILFAWGVVEFIRGAAEPEKRITGQKHMVWGILGLAIIFGAKVIVMILANIVGAESPNI